MASRQNLQPGPKRRTVPELARPHFRFLRRWLALGVSGFLLVNCGCRAGSQSAAVQSTDEKPVAVIGNELLYEKDYVPALQGELQKIRMAEYELKRKGLEAAINKRLLQAEAAKRGVKEEDLLRQEADSRVAEPDESEIERLFVQQMLQGSGQITQSKDEIRQQMKEGLIARVREPFFQGLREQAGVKIYLLPPAIDVSYDSLRVRGNPDARITLVEFSDFQCPFCRQAYTTVKSLLQKYDGKIKLAYRDLPLQEVRADVKSAGEACRCAGDQGQFWPYHDLLFENQFGYGPDGFREFARSLNLNLEQFGQCLESGKYKAKVREDFQEAIRLGATGTPYFFINGVPLTGAKPQQEFEAIIEAQLATMAQ
jgi:protein-disulfide isomerase